MRQKEAIEKNQQERKQGLTLLETDKRIEKGKKQVRQIESKVMWKLRRPSCRLPLRYGKRYQELMMEVKTVKA